jgi:hypothetical protein
MLRTRQTGIPPSELLRADAIGFAHQRDQLSIDIVRRLEAEMMNASERAEVLDAPQTRMIRATPQP